MIMGLAHSTHEKILVRPFLQIYTRHELVLLTAQMGRETRQEM